MTLLTIHGLQKDFGIKEIIKDASFSIDEQDKVGLIGVNGSGKSTLLKILAGLDLGDRGEIIKKSGARIVYLPQQPEIEGDRTVLEQVFAHCGPQMQLIKEYEDLSHRLAQVDEGEQNQLLGKLATITEKIDTAGAWDLETTAKIILHQLGIEDFETKVGELSGGYRKRIALAAALMSEPDLLLMDEPTNHLDAASVDWLQDYLQGFTGALFVITHDRYFLDQVTNRILELDQGDLFNYQGNYSYYLEKKAQAEEAEASSQQKHQGRLRRELEWLKRGPKARSTKQKARIDRIRDMQDQTFRQVQDQVQIDTPGRRIGTKVIEVQNIAKSFGDRPIIADFSYEFNPGDRVGIIGCNGAGKSTLMNILTGKLSPDRGTVEIGSTIHFGYFDQHSEDILTAADAQQRVIDYIKDVATYVETADGTQISASQMLERFLFTPNQQYTPIHKLSGGEKRRLFLLRMLMGAPNVILLDEPTNDLDVQTLSVLEEYLQNFQGCVLVVSHDRYFLDRTVETIFAIEEGGAIRQYPGNYSTYLDYKQKEAWEAEEARKLQEKAQSKGKTKTKTPEPPETPAPSTATRKGKSKRLSNYQRRELEKLEGTIIPDLEQQKAQLESQLYENPPSDYQELEDLSASLAQLTQQLDQATEKWLELAELAD